jgi:hypothetical protein
MVNFAFGFILMMGQLIGVGGALPQVVEAEYPDHTVSVGKAAEVVLSINVQDGYLINHTPPMQLKLEATSGVTLAESSMTSPGLDPDSTDVYYVNIPDFKINLQAARPGAYEVPGELVYFFCSKADGFCARQTLNVRVPVLAE